MEVVRAVICMPEQANPVKVESVRALGAEVIFHGADFDEVRVHCENLAAEHGYRYIHSGNEPLLIAGVATCTLEILQAQPRTEMIVVPVGGGSGAAGGGHLQWRQHQPGPTSSTVAARAKLTSARHGTGDPARFAAGFIAFGCAADLAGRRRYVPWDRASHKFC
jgi:threonine dehydratase